MSKDDAWARILSAVQRIESSLGDRPLRQTAADDDGNLSRMSELEAELATMKAGADRPAPEASADMAALQAENKRLAQEVEQLRNALSSTDATGAELERLRMENDQLISGLALAEERYQNAKAAASQIAARVDRAIGRLDDAMKE